MLLTNINLHHLIFIWYQPDWMNLQSDMKVLFSGQIYIKTPWTKEYILVRERTAPPCVFQTFAHPTSPPACSVRQSGIFFAKNGFTLLLQCVFVDNGWRCAWFKPNQHYCISVLLSSHFPLKRLEVQSHYRG